MRLAGALLGMGLLVGALVSLRAPRARGQDGVLVLPPPPSGLSSSWITPPSAPVPASLVVIVSLDGLRPDAIGVQMPTLRRLRTEGLSATVARTIERTTTLPAHASMVTGQRDTDHGIRFNTLRPARGPIAVPSVFSLARASGLDAALFVAKNKLEHIAQPGVAHFESPSGRCARVGERAAAYLRTARDGVHFVHFAEPDSAGHRYGWMTPEYMRALRTVDRCLRDLVATLDARPDASRVLLLVTSDHGGHGRTHGTLSEADRRIPWIARGAMIRPGVIDAPVSILDTAATAVDALGLEAPAMAGTSRIERAGRAF